MKLKDLRQCYATKGQPEKPEPSPPPGQPPSVARRSKEVDRKGGLCPTCSRYPVDRGTRLKVDPRNPRQRVKCFRCGWKGRRFIPGEEPRPLRQGDSCPACKKYNPEQIGVLMREECVVVDSDISAILPEGLVCSLKTGKKGPPHNFPYTPTTKG